MHAQGSGKDLFKSKEKNKIFVEKEDINRRKKQIDDLYKKNGLNNDTIKMITMNSFYLRKNQEFDFIENYLLKIKKNVKWDKDNLKYLDDVYEDLYNIYFSTNRKKMITPLLLEGLGVVSNFPGNIDAMHAEGRFLQSMSLSTLNDWDNEKLMMKSGRLTKNRIKEYIAQLDNLNESQKKQLYKLDKYHYTDLILQIALLSNTFWPDDELKKYISKGMNHIKNSEYKEKLWSAKLNFTVNLMQYDLAYGDIKGFQSNHNILKSMMAEASGDYSKLLTIFNNSMTLLALYEKADLHMK